MAEGAQEPSAARGTPRATLEDPPHTAGGILRRLGPGLIIAGAIVGSGELIATTATGAEAGFWLLWLIIVGCVIKVFTQVELGRYTIVRGETTMGGLNEVPGPRLRRHGNWLVWYWLIMHIVSLGQLGGIIGGVGQAMAITSPLTEFVRQQQAVVDAEKRWVVTQRLLRLALERGPDPGRGADAVLTSLARLEALEAKSAEMEVRPDPDARIARARELEAAAEELPEDTEARKYAGELAALAPQLEELGEGPEDARDDRIWATIITVVSAVLLVLGRYGLIQSVATALVALFTAITVLNLVLLQTEPALAVRFDELLQGFSFRLPPAADAGETGGTAGLATALMAFGIIGVGATELVAYPYWCLEKGYARFTGPRDGSPEWLERARGWLRVLRWDAWLSMLVYTFATIAFYLVGAATLGRFDLEASGPDMVRTLAVMFEPAFGDWAQAVFLFGAIAVLYSTFFVANASHARVSADALRVFGLPVASGRVQRRWIKIFSAAFPAFSLTVYLFLPYPKALVLASGAMQAIMLPMLAGAALWFRYRRSEPRLAPTRIWDAFLWLSAFAMLVAGGYLLLDKVVL